MFKAYSLISKYNLATNYNGIFFYLQKLPIVGNKISNKVYKFGAKLMEAIPILKSLFFIIKTFLFKIIYYLFLNITLNKILNSIFSDVDGDLNQPKIFVYFLLFNLMGTGIMSQSLMENKMPKYFQIKMIGIRPKDYYLFDSLFKSLMDCLFLGIVFGALFKVDGYNFVNVLSICLFLFGMRLIIMYLSLFLYRPKNTSPMKVNTIVSIVLAVLPIAGFYYLLFTNNFYLLNPLLEFLTSLSALVLGLVFFVTYGLLLVKGSKLEEISYKILRASSFKELNDASANIRTQEVKIKSLDESVKVGEFEQYKGIEYINKIFFHRTRLIFRKKILIRCAILISIAIGAQVVRIYFPQLFALEREDVDQVFRSMGMLIIFVGYMFYLRDNFTKFTFFNMDSSLMKYNFYRYPKILDESIKYRFKKSLSLNAPILLTFLLTIFSIYYSLGGRDVNTVLLFGATAIISMVFFSTHYLYMYYLIQPFTAQLEVKNMAYSMVNGALYILLYFSSTKLGPVKPQILIGILFFTVIYIFVGFLLVRKYAFRRFRLR